ncbi:MAG: nucleotidyltransferase family protein [Alistipes sp.]|nr:nucleotidyltransferase family protein [Candidatus Alistipes equi]
MIEKKVVESLVYLLRVSQCRELFEKGKTGLTIDDFPQVTSSEALPCCSARSFFSALSEKDWDSVFELSCLSGVDALLFDAISLIKQDTQYFSSLNLSRNIFYEWMSAAFDTETDYEHKKKAISELSALYSKHGFRMMLLKGYGLSLNYLIPNHRTSGDIDIYLFGKWREADNALRKKEHIDVKTDVHHHTTFFFQGVHVENHFDFVNIQAHLSNRRLEKIMKRLALDENETISVLGQRVYIPNPQLNALFLLRHMAMHFAAERIILRHVMDFACFMQCNKSRIDFKFLQEVAKRENMDRFLSIVIRISERITGFDFLINEYLSPVDEKLLNRVFNDILSPEWTLSHPDTRNLFRIFIYRFRRWRANSWKHNIVFTESLFLTFVMQFFSHLYKPKSLFR